MSAASLESLAVSRLTFGARSGDVDAVAAMGLGAWLESQLTALPADDVATQQALLAARLPIRYRRLSDGVDVNEDRPLGYIGRSLGQLWPLHDDSAFPDWWERVRPLHEVQAATWIRALASPYQLRELMVQFWHNHFSVDGFSEDEIAATFPDYDRLIRSEALGNFRALLGKVAKSTAMLCYLDNRTSRRQHPNENYARELMELHTLGIARYAGRSGSSATGYSDDDVLAAARALTGWTLADGWHRTQNGSTPDDGSFLFSPSIHDTDPKSLLGLYFPGTAGIGEGEAILDHLARHAGTADFLATKLCRRFVSDDPPRSLVARVAAVWQQKASAADQIPSALREIVLSPEFAASGGQKVKDPFRLALSFLRAAGAGLRLSERLQYVLQPLGYRQFEWPTPDGMPDLAVAWTGTNGMLRRWNLVTDLVYGDNRLTSLDLATATPSTVNSSSSAVAYWTARLLPVAISEASYRGLLDYAAQGDVLGGGGVFRDRRALDAGLRRLVAAIGMIPEFQTT
jgi:uncharacterized protein (DUF1800 family)